MIAKISCWIGIISSVIIAMLFLAENSNEAIGLLVLIGGSLFSWVGSFITYGFGQLVENSDKLLELNTHKDDCISPSKQTNVQKSHQLKLLQEKGLITEEEFIVKMKELQGSENE